MSKTVLLLGATGFAGTHFISIGEAAGLRVVGASRARSADVFADLLDRDSLFAAVQEVEPDAVVNLAGSASVAESWRDPAAAEATNAIGVESLLDAVEAHAPTSHVLCISSGEVYGELSAADLPATEKAPLRPANPYARSKARMEEIFLHRMESGSFRGAIARAFNHIGPGQSDRFALSSFARQIAEAELAGAGVTAIAVGDLSPQRDFSDVRDVTRAYLLMTQHELEGVYNVCSGVPRSIGTVAGLLAEQTDLEVHFEIEEDRLRPIDVPISYGSADRIEAATGWAAQLPLEQSLADLLGWWRVRL